MNINLSALGITEEALTNAVLGELGLTKEQAVQSLASKLGVSLATPASTIKDGSTVATEAGESVAKVLTPAEIDTLRKAAAIQARIFA